MSVIQTIASYAGSISAIFAAATILIKPLREWVFGIGDLRDGFRCSLRSDMLHTYYRHKDEKRIRQYELENFILSYRAYKRLKGNSFIEKVNREVMSWEVIT